MARVKVFKGTSCQNVKKRHTGTCVCVCENVFLAPNPIAVITL